jgi:membrane protein required for colicin V production
MSSGVPSLPWLDWAWLALLAVSLLIGLWRGFVFECLSLAGWVAAWFAAQWAAPQLAPHLPIGSGAPALNLAAALVLCFVLALLVWGLAARLVRMLIQASPLSIADRLLGGAFGALRAVVLGLAVAAVVTLTPAAQSATWRASSGARWLHQTLAALKPLLPEEWGRWLNGGARGAATPRP